MSLAYKTTLPFSGLAVLLFSLFLSVIFELTLQLSALLTMSLSLGLSFSLPTIVVAIGITAALTLALNLALTMDLPSFNVDLSLAFSFELTLVLTLLAQLEILLAINATLVAYGWFGPGSALGPAIGTVVGSAWADGTPSEDDVTVVLLVATSTGTQPADTIDSLSLLAAPPAPPAPANPPLPDEVPYPPPQAYEAGLAGVTISPPPPGGRQAVGTVVVDDTGVITGAVGIGAIIGVVLLDGGSGYTSPPTVTITDTVTIVSASSTVPIVLTLPNALTIPAGKGFGASIMSTDGTTTPVTAKVITPTTVELYTDQDMTIPATGSFAGGTLTGGGTGAAALAVMGGGSQNAIKLFFSGLKWPNVSGVIEGGVITLQDTMPGVFTTLANLNLNLQARASLLGSVSAGVSLLPPSIGATIDFVASVAANLQANLDVELPDLGASLAAELGLQVDAVAELVASIGLYLGFSDLEVEVWEYTGPGSGLGDAIAAVPGVVGWHDGTPASTPVAVGIFGLTTPAAQVAFQAFFPGA